VFYQWLRPFAVGLVHGLAGSAAVALMVLSIIREPVAALGYLLLFGLGTIVGMMLITLILSAPLRSQPSICRNSIGGSAWCRAWSASSSGWS
jgi:sulfite exporter TauE/SafE